MLNFTFYNPTKIVFGKNTIPQLSNLISKNTKIMMIYGGGSIKKNGVYEQVKKALLEFDLVEFDGIEPNPEYKTCLRAVKIAKEKNIDFLLAVGGGSVIDATKFIASAFYFKGDAWDIIAKQAFLKQALPIGCVLTLPATGSEMNRNSVISKKETSEKKAFYNDVSFPKFSILDPETTFSLPKEQTINGIIDIFIHVVEQYITYNVNTPLQDRQAEAILSTLIEEAPKVLQNPKDYNARANIMWCATSALNHNLSCGTVGDWATHVLSYELTSRFGLDHAKALAIILPSLWKHQKEKKEKKLAQYGKRIFDINNQDTYKTASDAIQQTEEFFNFIGMATKLNKYGVTFDMCQDIPSFFTKRNLILGENQNLGEKEIYALLKGCI